MTANARLFWILSGFFVISDAGYTVWALLDTNFSGTYSHQVEWVGTVGIGLSAILSAFIAFYLGRVHSAQGGELPQDIPTANIDDGDPEQGEFSPWSWWPLMLASALALVFLGLAVGVWISFIGVSILAISIVGWVYEYYRGYFAR